MNAQKQRKNHLEVLFLIIHNTLEGFHCAFIFPIAFLVMHYGQLFTILINLDASSFGSLSAYLDYLNYLLPYRLAPELELIPTLVVLSALLAFELLVVGGSVRVYKQGSKKTSIASILGFLMYFFQYVLFLPVCGLLLLIIKTWHSGFQIVFLILAVVDLLFCMGLQMVLSLLFFNFSFETRDPFARSPTFHLLFFDLLQLGLVLIDAVFTLQFQDKILQIFSLVIAVLLLLNFTSELPYLNYRTTMLNFFLIVAYFWLNLSLVLSSLLPFDLAKNHAFSMYIIGILFITLNIYYYFDLLFKLLINKNLSSILSESMMEKHIRYIHRLIEMSSKSKVDELMLASLIHLHMENCASVDCVCKIRKTLFDPITNQNSNPGLAIFKDPVFLKNFLLMKIQEAVEKFGSSPRIQLLSVMHLLDQFNNFGVADEQLSNLLSQKSSLIYHFEICRFRISKILFSRMKVFNKSYELLSNPIENIIVYDQLNDELRDNIIQLVDSYCVFWDIISENINELRKLKQECNTIMTRKKRIKGILKQLNEIASRNPFMQELEFFYYNFIIFEPEKLTKLAAQKKNQLKMNFVGPEESLSTLDLFSDSVFIVKSNFGYFSHGRILWASRNTTEITGYENQMICTLNVSIFMPRMIAENHTAIVRTYLKEVRTTVIGKVNHLWILTNVHQLKVCDVILKPFMCDNRVHMLGYFEVFKDPSRVLMNEWGEIDCFGENFSKVSGIDYDVGFLVQNLSLFMMLPQMVIHFLPFFYGNPDFKIDHLDYGMLTNAFFLVYSDMKTHITELSRILREVQGDKRSYCQALYKYLKELKYGELIDVYQVEMELDQIIIERGKLKVKIWQMKIKNFYSVFSNFSFEHYAAQNVFLEKINWTTSIQYSLERYSQRVLKRETLQQELEKHGETFVSPMGNTDSKSVLKQIFKKDKKNEEDRELLEDSKKKKATDIIRKLFIKTFSFGKAVSEMPVYKQRLIRAINNHNIQKNGALSMAIECHIEELPRGFDRDKFKKITMANLSLSHEERKAQNQIENRKSRQNITKNASFGSVRSSASGESQIDVNVNFKQKIKKNLKTKKNVIRVILLLTALAQILRLAMSLYFRHTIESHDFLALRAFYVDKFKTTIEIMTGLYNVQRFIKFHMVQVFEDVEDLNFTQDLVDRFGYEYTSFYDDYQKMSHNVKLKMDEFVVQTKYTKTTAYVSLLDFYFDTFEVRLGEEVTMLNLVQFFQEYSLNIDFRANLVRSSPMFLYFEANFDSFIKNLFRGEDKLHQKIEAYYAQAIMNAFLQVWTMCVLVVVILIASTTFTISLLGKSNSIFVLFSKLRWEEIDLYKLSAQKMSIFLKTFSRDANLCTIVKRHKQSLDETKKSRINKVRSFTGQSYLILKSLLLVFFMLSMFWGLGLFKYDAVKYDLTELKHNYRFITLFGFYAIKLNVGQYISLWQFQVWKTNSTELVFPDLFRRLLADMEKKIFLFKLEPAIKSRSEFMKSLDILDNCELIQHSEVPCDDFSSKLALRNSFRTPYNVIYISLLKFRHFVDQGFSHQQLISSNFFPRMHHVVELTNKYAELLIVILRSMVGNLDAVIEDVKQTVLVYTVLDVCLFVLSITVGTFLANHFLMSLSMENSSFIKVLPLYLVSRNQYFKIYLNKKRY